MTRPEGVPANEISGDVLGPVVQAHTIHGGVVFQGSQSRCQLRPMRLERPESLGDVPLSQLLAARNGVIEFTGRAAELDTMRRWRDEQPTRPAVLLIHGPGGQGKTRLVARFATECQDGGWDVLEAVHALGGPPGPGTARKDEAAGLLIVVDYAERWPAEDLMALLEERRRCAGIPLRLVLVARSADWWMDLRYEFVEERFRTEQLRLGPLAVAAADREALFDQARDRFAEVLGATDASCVARPGTLGDPAFALVLSLHMAALAAVDAHTRDCRPPDDPVAISAYLLDRERAYWRRLHEAGRMATRPATVARTVFVACLTMSLPYQAGSSVLDLTGVTSPAEPAAAVLADHRTCYPPADTATVLEPLYPDRLAEDFVALLLPGHQVDGYEPDPWTADVPARLLADEDSPSLPTVVRSALTVLVEAARRWPHLGERHLSPLLHKHPQLALAAGGTVLGALAELDDLAPGVLEAIEALLPHQRDVDLDLGIAALAERLTNHRIAPETGPVRRAALYADLGTRLSFAGRHAEALEVTRKAVRIRRALTGVLPHVFRQDLARSLRSLGVCLAQLGRLEEALAASDEALAAYEALADTHPEVYRADLAGALDQRASCLSELGRHRQAVSASEQAVRIRRESVGAHGGAGDPELAKSLLNLAANLAGGGRYDAGLAVAQEASDVLRRLADVDPRVFQPELALCLNNISGLLSELGRNQDALAAAREAVDLYRHLAEHNPAVFEPELARSLYTCSTALSCLGRAAEAVRMSAEAVRIYRQVSLNNPRAWDRGLALALRGFAQDLSDLGRHGQAADSAAEAVQIQRRLDASNPAGFRPALAEFLRCHSRVLSAAGRHDQALTPALEAVEVLRTVLATDPATFGPDLAAALNALGNRLFKLERLAEAASATEEAVTIYRTLTGAGGNHQAELAGSLTNLATSHLFAERPENALTVTQEAVGLYRGLARSNPPEFLPHLGRSLKSLAVSSAQLGRWREALAAVEELVHVLGGTADAGTQDGGMNLSEVLVLRDAIQKLARLPPA